MYNKLFALICLLFVVGCAPVVENAPQEGKKVPVYCSESDKAADVCTADVNPACGWFNEDIKCIKYPCAATYSNSCNACIDEKVAYWTQGECPA